jgi:hypothetical protein
MWSGDGRKIAAVSNDRTIGVWNARGTLQHVLPLDSVISADNAAIAFNNDGTLLATCSGQRADLWDLTSGHLKQTWSVPLGLADLLAFPSESQLMLARNEIADKRFVFRLRNLLAKDPQAPVTEIRDFPPGIFDAVISRDGSRIVIDGLQTGRPWARSIRAYSSDGSKIFSHPTEKTDSWGAVALDSTDHAIAMTVANGTEWDVVEAENGNLIGRETGQLRAMALGGKKRLKGLSDSGDPSGSNRLGLFSGDAPSPDVVLEVGRHVTSPRAFAFSADGAQAAWGNRDGTVTLCDFVELQRRLAELGLGW